MKFPFKNFYILTDKFKVLGTVLDGYEVDGHYSLY
jgi:hypothetical protein